MSSSWCQRITQMYPHQFDALLTISQNEAMRAAFPIRDLYIAAIDEAEHSILLTTAYFIPDHILVNALKDAVSRGVDVRVLLPWQSNHVLADWMAHSYFTDCLKSGIRIFGYRYTMLHAKTCTIDGEWSTVGTCNLDRLSLVGNYEINLAVYSTAFAQHMFALFAKDTAERFELTREQGESTVVYESERAHTGSPALPDVSVTCEASFNERRTISASNRNTSATFLQEDSSTQSQPMSGTRHDRRVLMC